MVLTRVLGEKARVCQDDRVCPLFQECVELIERVLSCRFERLYLVSRRRRRRRPFFV